MTPAECTIDDCSKPQHHRGLCAMHDSRLYRTGSVEAARRPTFEERFWSQVEKADGCWLWTGRTNRNGYGVVFRLADSRRRLLIAHIASFELAGRARPDGMHLDHVCHTRDLSCAGGPSCAHRRCVNPDHLEPVTPAENCRRGRVATSQICPNGHPRTPENTRPSRGRGSRRCRPCETEKQRRLRARRKERANAAR